MGGAEAMALKVVRWAAVQWPVEFPPVAQAPAACTHCVRDSKTERIFHGSVIILFSLAPDPSPLI